MSDAFWNEVRYAASRDAQRRISSFDTSPKQPELFWTAAVLRGDEVVWSKPSQYASSRDALSAAHLESVRFPDATHARASNGVDNVLERV